MNRYGGIMAVVVVLGVLIVVGTPLVAQAAQEKGQKRFGVRVGYFDPSEPGPDAGLTLGVDYFATPDTRVSVEGWSYSEWMYDEYGNLFSGKYEFTPITVTRMYPGKADAYWGVGVGWYNVKLTASVPGYGSQSFSGSDFGFHVLGGKSLGERGYSEVKYSMADVDVEGAKGKAGGLTLAYGFRF